MRSTGDVCLNRIKAWNVAGLFWVKEAETCPDPTFVQTSFRYCGHHGPVSSDLPRAATEGWLCCFSVTNKSDKTFTTLPPGAGDGAQALLHARHTASCVCFIVAAAGLFGLVCICFETQFHIVQACLELAT